MAKMRDLIYRTNRIVDDEFDNRDIVDWFNQCQSEALAHVLYLPATTNLPLNSTGTYTLPKDYKSDLVLINSQATFDIFGNELRIIGTPKPSTLTIEYNRFPKTLTTSPTQIPDIPEQFHDLYVFYGAMMAMLSDEEHERYVYFRDHFIAAMQGLKQYMDKVKSSRITHKAMTWAVIR